ncbi:MAG TPA: SH3 domain-containing protein [Stellaceae bacterium]|nr:SH3 domain-containing protein [Stellaceae bacterium]
MANVKGGTTGATAPRGFALDLAAVLAPYGRRGRLAVRVERMRDGARLSKGRNNGDNTWSLAPEELEGVLYLPPDDRVHADRLALRIIELNEEGGTTLAVVEFPLAPSDATPLAPGRPVAENVDAAELDRLRHELAAATELAETRASELAELRRAAELAGRDAAGRTIESELTTALETARAAWDAELQQRLGEAQAALETSRALAQAENADAVAQAEARGRAAREAARAEAKAEREAARAEHEAALAAAEAAWRADAQARLAEAEQRQAQAEQALAAAEARSRAEADARLVEAERRQVQAEQALAAVTARLERTERALNEVQADADAEDGEVRRLREALAALTASHEAAKGELAHWRQRAELAAEESAKKRDAADIETALATARAAWEAELTRRLEEAAAAADAHLAASRAAWQAEEAERRVAAEARLEERIEERLAAAREEGRQAAATPTAAAPDAAAVAEAQAGRAAAERQLVEAKTAREDAARELAALAKRLERSEAALAQARTHAERDEAELARLRQGVADLSARLDDREADLVRAQSALDEAQRGGEAGVDAQRQQLQRVLASAPTPVPRRSPLRRLVPAGAVAAVAALVAVFLSTGNTLVGAWWLQVVSVAIGDEPAPATGTSSEPSAPASPAVAARRGVVGATGANLRAGPSTSSAVIATLPRDAEVTLVERRGSWMQVRAAGRDGTRQQEGWVYAPSLKELHTAQP